MESFKEYIEEQIDLKRVCTIKFRAVDGAVSIIKARIAKWDTVSERDMIETDAGLFIGLDQIIEVNNRVQENYC